MKTNFPTLVGDTFHMLRKFDSQNAGSVSGQLEIEMGKTPTHCQANPDANGAGHFRRASGPEELGDRLSGIP
jgi:hypothetical protein